MVRLVRACGSKHSYPVFIPYAYLGQARKSLWIETILVQIINIDFPGQARKSLWIETGNSFCNARNNMVRLVRACGSKRI